MTSSAVMTTYFSHYYDGICRYLNLIMSSLRLNVSKLRLLMLQLRLRMSLLRLNHLVITALVCHNNDLISLD